MTQAKHLDPFHPHLVFHRVEGGDCWIFYAQTCRTAFRVYSGQDYHYYDSAFALLCPFSEVAIVWSACEQIRLLFAAATK